MDFEECEILFRSDQPEKHRPLPEAFLLEEGRFFIGKKDGLNYKVCWVDNIIRRILGKDTKELMDMFKEAQDTALVFQRLIKEAREIEATCSEIEKEAIGKLERERIERWGF